MKKCTVIGGSVFLIGCLMFCVTMSTLNWDFTKLSNRPPFEEKSMVVENNNQTITFESSNVDISIALSQDDKIHFIYSEREKEIYEFDQGKTIAIKKIKNNYKWYEYLTVMDFMKEEPFQILLPANFAGKLDLSTNNAKVEVEDVSLQNIAVSSSNGKTVFTHVNILDGIVVKTNNGMIDFNGLQADGKIDLSTNNGFVNLHDISAKSIAVSTSNNKILANDLEITDNIMLTTTNGRIEFDLISAKKSIVLSTDNNRIKGVLPGKVSDYNITSKTVNGKNSLPERMPDGEVELNVSVMNGNIDILFDDQ